MSLHRTVFFALTALLLFAACTKVRLNLALYNEGDYWLTSGGNLQHHHYRDHGPQPPLHLFNRLKFTAAPVQYLVSADSMLFIPTQNGRIYTYHLASGKIKGKFKLPDNVEGAVQLHPQGFLLIGLKLGHETLLCYDLKAGKYVWKIHAGLLWSPPIPADSSVYVVARFKHADRYDLKTGERIWRFAFDSQAYAAPALSDKLMIFATDKGKVIALYRATGKKVWQYQNHEAIFAAPVVSQTDGRVFVASLDSTITALELNSGNVVWQYKSTGSIRQTPAFTPGHLVFSNGAGAILDLDSNTGKPRWQTQHEAPFGTSPLIVRDIIYLGGLDKNLYALDLKTGKVIWKTLLKGRVRTNPIVFYRYLVVGSEDRYVYLFTEAEEEATE